MSNDQNYQEMQTLEARKYRSKIQEAAGKLGLTASVDPIQTASAQIRYVLIAADGSTKNLSVGISYIDGMFRNDSMNNESKAESLVASLRNFDESGKRTGELEFIAPAVLQIDIWDKCQFKTKCSAFSAMRFL